MAKKSTGKAKTYSPISAKNFPNATRPDVTHAGAMTDATFLPKEEQLQSNLRQIRRDKQYDVDTQKELGQIHDKRIGEISKLLGNQLSQNTQRVRGTYEGAQSGIEDAYTRALQQSEGASQSVLDSLRESMQRLGLEAAEKDGTSDILQQLTDNRARNATARAGAVGNIANLGADMTAIAQKTEGDAAQEWSFKRNEFAQQVRGAIEKINHDFLETRNGLLQQLSSLQGQKGAAFTASLMDVINQRLERERQARLDKLNEMVQREQLSIARGHLGVAQGNLALSRQKLQADMEAQRLAAEQANNPLDKLKYELEYKETQKALAELESGGTTSRQYKGQEGVYGWGSNTMGDVGNELADYYMNMRIKAGADAPKMNLSPDEMVRRQIANEPPDVRGALDTMDNIFTGRHHSFVD